jgi:fatty-acyl-CoA synthase
MTTIRSLADILEVERRGLEALAPEAAPFEIIEATARAQPDAIALRFIRRVGAPEHDVVISYLDFANRIRRGANLFRRLGLNEHDSVAILAPHTASCQIALWAAEVAGRACPINPLLRPDHVVELLRACGARIAIVLGVNDELDIWSKLAPTLRASGVLTHILDCDADQASADSDGAFETLLAAEKGEYLTFSPNRDRNAIASCFHTGGTTGAPKLAMHTRGNEAFIGRAAALMYDLSPNDVVLNGFPLFHVAGAFVYGLSTFAAGASLLIPTRLGLRNAAFMQSLWKQVEHYRVTVLGCVPTILSAMNTTPVNADISSVRVVLTGGSPLPSELADAFERNVGKPVRNILGMTECSGVVTIEPFHGPRVPNSTGLRLPFTEVRAFAASPEGADLACPLPYDQTGVLALRGPHVSPGYSDDTRNPGTFEPEGWLITGDLGHIDIEGRVFVTGRAKDVIIRGAHNIDPAMIEDALLQHPDVSIAAAIGQPDAYAGELPVAYVTLKPGAYVEPIQLLQFISPRISEPAAIPKRIEILTEMPTTPVGKIFKPILRDRAADFAIKEALERSGLSKSQYRLTNTGFEYRLVLTNADAAPTAQGALLGMPIKIAVELQD